MRPGYSRQRRDPLTGSNAILTLIHAIWTVFEPRSKPSNATLALSTLTAVFHADDLIIAVFRKIAVFHADERYFHSGCRCSPC